MLTTKDIGRLRVKKWNDWDEMLEEEQTKIGTKSILSKNATKRMTRSSSRNGVTFDKTLFIETPGTSDSDSDNLRKQEQSTMLANLQGNLSVSDSKNGARLEWWVKDLYNDSYHWIRIHYQIIKIIYFF